MGEVFLFGTAIYRFSGKPSWRNRARGRKRVCGAYNIFPALASHACGRAALSQS
jgi:hypothetical protein